MTLAARAGEAHRWAASWWQQPGAESSTANTQTIRPVQRTTYTQFNDLGASLQRRIELLAIESHPRLTVMTTPASVLETHMTQNLPRQVSGPTGSPPATARTSRPPFRCASLRSRSALRAGPAGGLALTRPCGAALTLRFSFDFAQDAATLNDAAPQRLRVLRPSARRQACRPFKGAGALTPTARHQNANESFRSRKVVRGGCENPGSGLQCRRVAVGFKFHRRPNTASTRRGLRAANSSESDSPGIGFATGSFSTRPRG
jgi:hypothetical protein